MGARRWVGGIGLGMKEFSKIKSIDEHSGHPARPGTDLSQAQPDRARLDRTPRVAGPCRGGFVPGRCPRHGLSGHFPCQPGPKNTAYEAYRASLRPACYVKGGDATAIAGRIALSQPKPNPRSWNLLPVCSRLLLLGRRVAELLGRRATELPGHGRATAWR